MSIASEFAAVEFLFRSAGVSFSVLNEKIEKAKNASVLQKMQAASETVESAVMHLDCLQDNQSAILALMQRINARLDYLAVRAGVDLDSIEGL